MNKRNKVAEVMGITGAGETIAEAKAEAKATIVRMAALDGSPRFVQCRGEAALLYHSRGYIHYSIITDEGTLRHFNDMGYGFSGCFDTWEEADRAARNHLGQIVWKPEDGTAVPDCVRNPRDRAELVRYFTWQINYRWLRLQGATDEEARQQAPQSHLLSDERKAQSA